MPDDCKSGENRSFSCIFASERLPDTMRSQLAARGLKFIPLPPFDKLAEPVACHADMLLFPLGDALLIHEAYYQRYPFLFSGCTVETTDEAIGPEYPNDILFNGLKTEAGLICLAKCTSRRMISQCREIINVKQGYARCSSLLIDGSALITADPSIAQAALRHGLDLLQIRPGGIALPGYAYGFIGGCCVQIGRELLFTGQITDHPDFAAIAAFAMRHGCRLVSMSQEKLTDYGGFVIR